MGLRWYASTVGTDMYTEQVASLPSVGRIKKESVGRQIESTKFKCEDGIQE